MSGHPGLAALVVFVVFVLGCMGGGLCGGILSAIVAVVVIAMTLGD